MPHELIDPEEIFERPGLLERLFGSSDKAHPVETVGRVTDAKDPRSNRARYIRVEVPLGVDEEAGAGFWASVGALCRPRSLGRFRPQEHICFEAYGLDGEVSFGIWVPVSVAPAIVQNAIETAWPSATFEVGHPPYLLPVGWLAAGGDLRLTRGDYFSLKTELKTDPLRGMFKALATVSTKGAGAYQVLVRPGADRMAANVRASATRHSVGKPLSAFNSLFESGVDLVFPAASGKSPSGTGAGSSISEALRRQEARSMFDKAAPPSYEVICRYGVALPEVEEGPDGETCAISVDTAKLDGLAGLLASQMEAFTGANSIRRFISKRPGLLLNQRRMWGPGRGDLYCLAELAGLAHLPLDENLAGIVRAASKIVVASPRLYTSGKIVGDSVGAEPRTIAISIPDSRYHFHVMGATGSGKTTFLANLALADIEAGRGCVVVEPKGDVINDLLERWPEGKAPPTLIDAGVGDYSSLPTLNPFDVTASEAPLVVGQMVSVFKKIFAQYWGPRTDDAMKAASNTLLWHAHEAGKIAGLADIAVILTNPAVRKEATAALPDDEEWTVTRTFWDGYEAMGEAGRMALAGPLMNKVRGVLSHPFVAKLLRPATSTIDMADVLDSGCLLVRIPKGVIGEDATRLVGSLVLARLWHKATARSQTAEADRKDAAVYVDECHNFLNLPGSVDDILAEARSYRFSVVLAHQHLDQLPAETQASVSANARNKVYFTLSPKDARTCAPHMGPAMDDHDLSHTRRYRAACRLMVDGEEAPAFSLATRPLPPAIPGRRELVTRLAHKATRTAQRSPVSDKTVRPPSWPASPDG